MNETPASPAAPAPPTPVPPRPRRWRGILRGFLLFLLGAAVGAGALLYAARSFMRNPEKRPARILWFLDRRLDLDEGQEARVLEILKKGNADLLRLRLGIRREIEEALRPDQRETFQKVGQ